MSELVDPVTSACRGGVALCDAESCFGGMNVRDVGGRSVLGFAQRRFDGDEALLSLRDRPLKRWPAPDRRSIPGATAALNLALDLPGRVLGVAHRPEVWRGALSGLDSGAARGSERVLSGTPVECWRLANEVATLDDCWCIGTVVREHSFKRVARAPVVIGYDEQVVLVPTAGRAYVEAAVGGGLCDDGEADVDGVALVSMGGGGVAEAYVAPCVLGRQGRMAVSAEVGHSEAAVAMDGSHDPPISVADRLAVVGADGAVVAPGDDVVADSRQLVACDTNGPHTELARVTALLLDRVVERVHLVVGLGDDGDAAPVG
ncbi:MAG: hypothetical protein ACRDWD_11990, partial [Acidimicrobiia bacterium]